MRRATWFAGICAVIGSIAPAGVPTGATMLVHMPAHGRSAVRGTAYSTNWSGYATYNATFTDVKASWTQPAATCSASGRQYAAFWVGLDGYTSNSVEQIGTDSDCAGKNKPVYYGWYEMYPAGSVTLSSSYAVGAGDSMSAEVNVLGTNYTLTLQNATRGWTFTTTQTSTTAQNSSAEWVAEAPSSCFIRCTVLPLTDFGTVNFSGAAATSNGAVGTISAFTNDTIVMSTTRGTVKASPSPLSNGGASFADTWHHS